MSISKARKNELIKEYATHEGDTGSVEVQVAVLTEDINNLNAHLATTSKTTTHTLVCLRRLVTVVTYFVT